MADASGVEEFAGGPVRAPRSFPRRLTRALAGLLLLVCFAGLIVALAGALPSGIQTPALIARGAIGLGIGGLLIFAVRRAMRALVQPPPPPPQVVDARPSDVVYECAVCGTRVRLEVAATAKAPRHCGEEMEAGIG